MRKVVLMVGAIVGVLILVAAGLVVYAVLNLNSIIAARRGYILTRAGDAIGRPIEIADIKASVGWGIKVDVSGVQIADDPAFSQLPIFKAADIYADVEFVPLLSGDVRVTSLVLNQPEVRIVRNRAGVLNVSRLAKKSAAENPGAALAAGAAVAGMGGSTTEAVPSSNPTGKGGVGAIEAVSARSLAIEDGKVYYEDLKAGGAPATIKALNLHIDNLSAVAPFDVAMTVAAFGDQKNVEVSGRVGPLMNNGAIDIGAIPIAISATAGPVTQAELEAIPALAKAIPPQLQFSDGVTINAKASGTVDSINFAADGDLTANHLAYAPMLDKPAGVTLKLTASGSREEQKVLIKRVDTRLAALDATATDILFANGKLAARLDSNRFDIGGLAQVLTALAKYNPSGSAEIHASLRVANHKPAAIGSLTLANVNLTIPGRKVPVSDISGVIRFAGSSAVVDPLTFNLGSGHARLVANATSLQPVRATYRLAVDTVTIAELVPSRNDAGDETLSQFNASGAVNLANGVAATTNLTATSGMVAKVPFSNLAADAGYDDNRVDLHSLKLDAFDGAIAAGGVAILGSTPTFDLKVSCDHLDVQQALAAQQSKAAGTVRGILTATVRVIGRGSKFDEIKPTLHGNGSATLVNGKLVGVNVVAQALDKAGNIPAIGALVPASVVDNHPELFKSPDTDIQSASLTFVMVGPRIISHDITVRSPDYSILGDGWFDMDKNVDLAARILMAKAFSNELIQARRNVVYLADQNGQVVIPLRIAGQLPHPMVAPDVAILAQRAASHAIEGKLGGLLGKHGGILGGLLGGGGGSSGGGSGGGGFNPLKNLFH